MNVRYSRMKTLGAGVAVVAIVVGAVAFVLLCFGPKKVHEAKREPAVLRTRMIREASAESGGSSANRIAVSENQTQANPLLAKADDGLSEEIRKTAEELQKALDEEDFEKVQEVIGKVIESKNLFLLRNAISAARWFGVKALPELTGLAAAISSLSRGRRSASSVAGGGAGGGIVDPLIGGGDAGGGDAGGVDPGTGSVDPGEVEALQLEAMSAIEQQLNSIEDNAERGELLAKYMKASSDEDVLILLSGQLKTILDDAVVLDAVVEIIENGGSPESVVSAKDVYKFMTGADYSGVDAAQHWLDNDSIKPLQSQDAN